MAMTIAAALLLAAAPPRDPNALPTRAELEEALFGPFQCVDGEAEDCFVYVERIALDSARCTAIRPDADGKRRVACLVTGTISYTSLRKPERFADFCFRAARYTAPGQTPAIWGWSGSPSEDKKPCEARSRGTEID